MSSKLDQESAEAASEWIRDNAIKFAQAKANRVYLDEFRKSKKAILYQQAPDGSIADRENWAYSRPEYLELLDGLRAAVEAEEKLRWQMEAARLRIEMWRTMEASSRKS
jgi:hypothetical protein